MTNITKAEIEVVALEIGYDDLDRKLKMAKESYFVLAQQYHLLSNIIDKKRHSTKDWFHCEEESCKLTKQVYENIWGMP